MQLPFGKKDVGNEKTDNTENGGKVKALARKSVEKPKEPTGIFGAPAVIIGPRLIFIAAVVVLCVFGLVMIYSASSITAYASSDFNNDPTYFFKKQLMWLVIGTVCCVACAFIPHRFWANKKVSWALWGITAVLLAAVVFGLGTTSLGADRSLSIAGISIQPAELAKITVLLVMAGMLERYSNGEITRDLVVVELVAVSLVTLLLIYKQPDLGTAIILIIGILALFVLSGVSWFVIGGILLVGVLYAVVALATQPYHMDRIYTMLNPWDDPEDKGYQTIQGFLAFGSGGIFGTGLGMSRQKYLYLPYAYNDFIYAVIGEELGLIGALFTLLLFVALIFSGLRISRTAPDLFGSSVAGALTTMIGFQACVNMACVAGVAPVTGKALPFISYGGSSLLATMIMVGLILGISRDSRVDNQSEIRRENLVVMDGGRARGGQQGRGSTGPEPSSVGSVIGGIAGGIGGAFGGVASKFNRGGNGGKGGYAGNDSRGGYPQQDRGKQQGRSGNAGQGEQQRGAGKGRLTRNGSGSMYSTKSGRGGYQQPQQQPYQKPSRNGRAQRVNDDMGQQGRRPRRKSDLDVELIDIQPRLGRPERNSRGGRPGAKRYSAPSTGRGSSRSSSGARKSSGASSRGGTSKKKSIGYGGSENRGGGPSDFNPPRWQ